jgi:uncharacterized membrane protein
MGAPRSSARAFSRRGSGKKESDIRDLYEDIELTKKYLAKYGVDFVIVGDVERATYRPIATAKFEEHPEVFTKVASFGDTSIYRTYLSKYNPTYKSALKK